MRGAARLHGLIVEAGCGGGVRCVLVAVPRRCAEHGLIDNATIGAAMRDGWRVVSRCAWSFRGRCVGVPWELAPAHFTQCIDPSGGCDAAIGSRSETSTRRSRTQLRCVVRAAHAFRPAGRLAERRNGSAQRGRGVRVATTAAGRGECAARVVPAGSDDLTRNAGSTSPYGGARGCTGRYKDEVIRLDAPRCPRRSRFVDTARSGRGLARGAEMGSSRSSLVRNPIRPRLHLHDLRGRSFAYG